MRNVFLVACTVGALGSASVRAQESTPPPPPVETTPETLGVRPDPIADVYGYPALAVDQDEIVRLLKEGRFADLERQLQLLETATREDITRELELAASYRAFFGSDATIQARLDEWVASDPESGAALIARAHFHNARAWEARGEQVRVGDATSLRRSRDAGVRDAARALDLDPDNLAAHVAALRLQSSAGWSNTAANLVNDALARFPTSYWLRYLAAGLAEPRWGGSYTLMRELAEDAQRYVDANPRLATLRGAAAIDEAASLSMTRRYDEALEKLEEARPYGTDWDFYYQRGRTLFHDDRLMSALAALDSAIAIRPVSENVLEYRGWTLYFITRNEASPEQRAQYSERAAIDLTDAVKRTQADEDLSELLSRALAMRARCSESPVDCLDRANSLRRFEGSWWVNALLFIVSLPYTLYMIFVEGQRMHLLPAPLIGMATFLWSFREWRRQRYWTPRLIHVMAGLALATIVGINVAWVSAGGEMWTQRYVVIAIFGLFPYVTYLVFLGPKFLGRRRTGATAETMSDQPFD